MKHFKILVLGLALATATLSGCGNDKDLKAGENRYVSLHTYDRLEITRGNNSVRIELATGDATMTRGQRRIRCNADTNLREYLKDSLSKLSVMKMSTVCDQSLPYDYEVFMSDRAADLTVDGCGFEYSGGGNRVMDSVFNTYANYCDGGRPIVSNDRRDD
jgi:hypothetical protein